MSEIPMPIQDLREQIARLPEQPGIYIYYNAKGETLYVGKARSLRDRTRSYLGAYGMSPRHDALLDEATRLEVIVTDSVVEALALENNVIKQRAPRYNILLRDDKNYPYLQLTTTEAFPRVLVARSVERDGNMYAGPFLPAKFARRTMSLTHKVFGIRSCNEVITGMRHRPCLEYDIKRCLAPCVVTICSEERYAVAVADTKLFLEGRNQELAEQLRGRMVDASEGQRYEEAAQLRDAMRTVEAVRERQQKMASAELGDRDVFGVKAGASGAVVQVFIVRGGRVIERVELMWAAGSGPQKAQMAQNEEPEAGIIEAAIQQFYADHDPPPEIHVPVAPSEQEVLEDWLTQHAGRKVRIFVPVRGTKKGMMELAHRNAALGYRQRFDANATANYDALESLQAALRLPKLPRRIDCFDISTIQGSETVASMVVCEEGRMRPSEYRKFKIKPHDLKTSGPQDLRVPRRLCGHGTSCPPPLFKGVGERWTLSRSDRDRRRQGPVECRLCGARDGGSVESRRRGPREERGAGVHARQHGAARARYARQRPSACCSAFATKRIASRSRSIASRARSAICSRSSTSFRALACGGGRRC